MAGGDLIGLVAAVLAIGVAAQVVADRLRVPSVVFLLAAGLALGDEGLGLLGPDAFGGALSAIVGLSVAIIVFEGAYHLTVEKLRAAPTATLRLVTVGAAVSLLGTAAAVRYALGTSWDVGLLVGALLVATGPTVIAPVLAVVPVRDRVAGALETEGIVNDVTAAILAVVIFEAVVVGPTDLASLVPLFFGKLGTGLVVGLVVAAAVYYLLVHVDLSTGNAPQLARLLTLAGALVAYAGAELVSPESGIAAAATAGVVLGNADLPYDEAIAAFKGDVTLLVLSFVFVALAALLRVDTLVTLGVGGLLVVLAVVLLVRPVGVLLSTVGGRFTAGEKAFVGFVGPRGIIPASVATLFAIQLRAAGRPDAATVLVGTVFLVVFVTVVFEAGLARQFAGMLNVIPMRVIIVGGGKVGRSLAERLEDRGENVVIVEVEPSVVEAARSEGYAVRLGDGTEAAELAAAGADRAKLVVAATGDDDVNLLVAQLARSRHGVEDVIARVNEPDNVVAFDELEVRAISATEATTWAIDNAIERPAVSAWMTELGRAGDVQEVAVTAEAVVGRSIGELDAELPAGCLIALVSRDGDNRIPDPAFVVREGDHLTFLGRRDAVREAVDWCRQRG